MTEQLNTGICSFPKAYLLTGYVNKGKPISKLTQLFNRVVVADSDRATPILLSSDEDVTMQITANQNELKRIGAI